MIEKLVTYISLFRPKQWVKSGFVLAPLIFSLKFANQQLIIDALIATVAFILAAGAVYIFNDIQDREADKKHPKKKKRAIPSGKISVTEALVLAVLALAGSAYLSSYLSETCLKIVAAYIVINFLYSLYLKHVAILDVSIIALGFVLRVEMGGHAVSVEVSPWIILTTFLLALFLGFGKRLNEISVGGAKIRQALERYNKPLLDKLINVTCATALISYAIYAVDIAQREQKVNFVFTVFFVVFGLFRYLQHLYLDEGGGSPENIIYSDKLFAVNIIAWLATCIWILGA